MKFKRMLPAIVLATIAALIIVFVSALIFSEHKKQKKSEPFIESTPRIDEGYAFGVTEVEIYPDDLIVDLTMFINEDGTELSDDNEIRELLAQRLGIRLKETYGAGNDVIDEMISSGELADLIYTKDFTKLYESGCLVAWDEYINEFTNLKRYFSDVEWDQFRMDDGHIYWASVFANHHNDRVLDPGHDGYAFWIQVRVLEELGYPEINTLDDFFNALETYYEMYPAMEDGSEIIPFTTLGNDTYCLESPAAFLDGYANDGCLAIDVSSKFSPEIVDFSNTETAEKYFRKLNEEYQKGMLDPNFYSQTNDEYFSKLGSGCVLGIYASYENFGYSVGTALKNNSINGKTLSELGCDYVPLGLTINEGMDNRWHNYGDTFDITSGISVTTSCEEPYYVFQFLDSLLDTDINILRFWGIEGVDYLIDSTGRYYRTEEMRALWEDESYLRSHVCKFEYCPQWFGSAGDGLNALQPQEQTKEYRDSLPEPVVNCLMAYEVSTIARLIDSKEYKLYAWNPMSNWLEQLDPDDPAGATYIKMNEVKAEYLPNIVISDDFDSVWAEYVNAYAETEPEIFFESAQDAYDYL